MVTIINRLTVHGDPAKFQEALQAMTRYMTAQPGFQSHRVYRSVNNPNVFVETAEWKDRKSHQAAIAGPELKDLILAIMTHGKAEPDVFEEIEDV